MLAMAAALGAGCGTEQGATRSGGTTPGSKSEAIQRGEPQVMEQGGVPPEKLDEINHFFYRKMGPLQFRCYNDEVERTHKKYQGNLSLSLVVQPGGKVSDVKVIASSLDAPGIEACVVNEVKQWEWPDVPSPAPYTGSINFKPAW
jgi:hypothetical protein